MLLIILFFINISKAEDFNFVKDEDININEGILIKTNKIERAKKVEEVEEVKLQEKARNIKKRFYAPVKDYNDEIKINQRADFNLKQVTKKELAATTYPDGLEVFDLNMAGMQLQTYLRNDLVSLSHKPMPIVVEVRDGGELLNGSYLIGETILDTISRAPIISFNKISLESGTVMNVKALGQFSDINKKCSYSSNKGKIFGLNILAAATSGWLNSQIPTDRGIFGSINVQGDNSFKTQTIQGVSEATRGVSNDLIEEFKKSGAFSICKGKRYLNVSVVETPSI